MICNLTFGKKNVAQYNSYDLLRVLPMGFFHLTHLLVAHFLAPPAFLIARPSELSQLPATKQPDTIMNSSHQLELFQ